MNQKRKYTFIAFLIIALALVNYLASQFHHRLDLTQDKRYSLSPAAKNIIAEVKSPLFIDVFLKGNFPPEFRRLENETRHFLEEVSAFNSNIIFNFIDPLAQGDDANAIAEEFYAMGMTPARLSVMESGRATESIIFPWALANFKEKTLTIPLLKNKLGISDEERVNSSVQQMEYSFVNALNQLVRPREKKIAVMRGNGELPDPNIADFIHTLRNNYFIAPFSLNAAEVDPVKTLDDLLEFDLLIEAKPTEAFTENEKYILDQYLMKGGKMLWLVEHTSMETDSLFNDTGSAFALPLDLNLSDLFFSYGFRINPVLVNDLYSTPIILASGSGNDTKFSPYPWFYSPLTTSPNTHPIINNLEAVKFDWANPIDTLRNAIDKTILLTSSPQSKQEGTPREISLDIINTRPDMASYAGLEIPLAVLLEGKFTSVYRNRIKPFSIANSIENGTYSQMIVISDGDVIKNQLQQGAPLELGFDRFTGNTYGNKEFLLNSVNYLLDDTGLIDIRSKMITIPFLNVEKASEERVWWQSLNLAVPLILLLTGALGFNYFRKRRYVKK